ncbi:MAG: IS66 family insertion sequence element accessory protein TnpA [Terriglobales bacterium]
MNKAEQRRELWRQRIAQQESSGQSIRAYCRGRGLQEHAFYGWRQRLRKENRPVRFALVETKTAAQTVPSIELILASGERLRIPQDAAALKLVLAVLRQPA